MVVVQAVLQAAAWVAERNMKITRIQLIQMIREAAEYTNKYNDSKHLIDDQSKGLHDELQRAIIDVKEKEINEDDDLEGEDKEDFNTHTMYHPTTGESEVARTIEQHLDLKGQGWGHEKPSISESKMKITRTQLKELIKEEIERMRLTPASMEESEWSADIDPQGVESPLSQELALEDNFEDEEMFSRESLITKIVEAELRGGFKGILDFVLGQDV